MMRWPMDSNWRPIDSAPRDATDVLVTDGRRVYVAGWWQEPDEPDEDGEWTCYMDAIEDPQCPIEPTHWMPLPAPPAPAQAGDRQGGDALNWKPMDTAPKDGRPVWARGNNHGDPSWGQHCAWVYWDDGEWAGPLHGEETERFTFLAEWLDVAP